MSPSPLQLKVLVVNSYISSVHIISPPTQSWCMRDRPWAYITYYTVTVGISATPLPILMLTARASPSRVGGDWEASGVTEPGILSMYVLQTVADDDEEELKDISRELPINPENRVWQEFSGDRQLHAAPANGELGWIRVPSAACGVNNRRSRLPDGENLRSGDLLASFPGGKPENKEIILNGVQLQGSCWSVLFFGWWEPL